MWGRAQIGNRDKNWEMAARVPGPVRIGRDEGEKMDQRTAAATNGRTGGSTKIWDGQQASGVRVLEVCEECTHSQIMEVQLQSRALRNT